MTDASYDFVALGSDGMINPALYLHSGGGIATGSMGSTDFGFSGTLAVRTGVQLWMSPDVAVTPLRLSATLGTLPTAGYAGAGSTFVLRMNGTEIGRVVISGTGALITKREFAVSTIPANSILTVDILTAALSTPTSAGDAVVQLLWST